VLVPEGNLGQLSRLVRAEFLVDARSVTKIQGVPFKAGELEAAIAALIEEPTSGNGGVPTP
jgi:2-oxoglutarate ferredoxin oxidoreductase subunit alpha